MNYSQYEQLIISTLKYYITEYQLQLIINDLVDNKLATYNRKEVESQVSFKGIVKRTDKIKLCLNSNKDTFKYIEFMEFYKGYRYSVYFKYTNLNEENVKEFALNVENIDFNNNIQYDIPFYIDKNDLLCIKFHKSISIPCESEQRFVDIRYPTLFIFHRDINILEVRFDRLTYKNDDNFYKITMETCIAVMKSKLKIQIESYDSDSVIKYIVDNKKNEVYESVQHVGMRGDKSAVLKAGKDSVMPFIGDLEKILKNNSEIFNKNQDSKECLNIINHYITQVKRFSDYKMRVLTWLNYDINDRNKDIDLKIIFSYKNTDYHLFNYYNPKITKMERMNYVINHIIKTQKDFDKIRASADRAPNK